MLRTATKVLNTAEPGFLYVWGDAYHTLLGQDTYLDPIYTPKRVHLRTRLFQGINDLPFKLKGDRLRLSEQMPDRFVKAATGPFHTAIINEKGELYTFGENDFRKLGHKRVNHWLPTKLGFGFQKMVDVACGYDFTIALSDLGTVYTWGYGGECITFWKAVFYRERPGALGQGDLANYEVPVPVDALRDVKVVEVQAGYEHALARSHDGQVFTWGNNECGGLGFPEIDHLREPKEISLPGPVQKISAARNYSSVLLTNGDVFVWGENSHKQLGLKDDIVASPVKIAEGVRDIEAGESSLMLIDEDGVRVSGFTRLNLARFEIKSKIASVSCGDEHFAVALTNGSVLHYGGLFESPNPHSYLLYQIPTELKPTERSFFPTKVLGLYGKYSYHVAILEATALMTMDN